MTLPYTYDNYEGEHRDGDDDHHYGVGHEDGDDDDLDFCVNDFGLVSHAT